MTEEEKIKLVFPVAARLTADYSRSQEYKDGKKNNPGFTISPEEYFKGEYSFYMKLLNEKLKNLNQDPPNQKA
ncbi:hypothetical protein VH79_25885 [Salmonella enterica]|uniref:Uncharacterized protein n=1 Tax=Salmonella enterica TaxID=28901 RepID=A0A5U3ITX1_SALER|nr:hypothetical protein [Salmonella enterica]EEH4116146.1 hypothetical protein [Salmonella enterica subsp. enterica serovar Hvittingfoss]EGI6492255.1 hypothetical protein [Salmonella enterica subsp. enterica serovar Hvittingfoss]